MLKTLETIKAECLACRRCSLGGGNVFSNMAAGAAIMLVGQNPGSEELVKGEPFVGLSGRFLMERLEEIGLSKGSCYITNAVHCVTPQNRKPTRREIDCCRSFLDAEIEMVRPRIIVALGGVAFEALTGMSGITKHVGDIVESIRYKVSILPLFHPSPLNMCDRDKREAFDKALGILARFVRNG